MQTGRKPSGLCGAALYIAALSHGYNYTKADIVSTNDHEISFTYSTICIMKMLRVHFFSVYDRHTVEHCVASILFYVSQVSVVHVCEATLTKRLIEFENTDAGSLTVCLFLP